MTSTRLFLTGIHAEVQAMAQKAGLVPRTFTFPETDIKEFGLIQRSLLVLAKQSTCTHGLLRLMPFWQ